MAALFPVFYADYCPVPLPPKHRFPMEKYALLREQLVYEGLISSAQLYRPELITDDIIELTLTPAYWQKIQTLRLTPAEERKLGFPQSKALVVRSLTAASGTFQAAMAALSSGLGCNLAGGTHHGFADRGEGFCVLNDVAISANWLLTQQKIKRALVIDLDVHQGNGTARIFAHNPQVFTFSMHGKHNYPLHKETSDLDIELPGGTKDEAYLAELKQVLPYLIAYQMPDIIYYIAGADVIAGDKLGKLALTKEGCYQRDKLVIEAAYNNKIPLVVVLGGGYADPIKDTIAVHTNTYRLLNQYY